MSPIERSAKKMSEVATALVFEIDARAPKKKERIRVTISAPYSKATGEWACLFELRGSKEEDEQREYFGADGLQALVLNLFYLRSVFQRLRKKGYSFHEIPSGAKIDPVVYFDVFSNQPNQSPEPTAPSGRGSS